jgi:hypothetical protein
MALHFVDYIKPYISDLDKIRCESDLIILPISHSFTKLSFVHYPDLLEISVALESDILFLLFLTVGKNCW